MNSLSLILGSIPFFGKKGLALLFSGVVGVSFIFEELISHIKEQNSTVYISILTILCGFSLVFTGVDFIVGVIASRYEGSKIQSAKWGNTTSKVIGLLMMYVLFSTFLLLIASNTFVLVLIFGSVLLTILKEFISIGENLERRLKKKPYIFHLIDRLFDIIEFKFFSIIQKKEDICETGVIEKTEEEEEGYDNNDNRAAG